MDTKQWYVYNIEMTMTQLWSVLWLVITKYPKYACDIVFNYSLFDMVSRNREFIPWIVAGLLEP